MRTLLAVVGAVVIVAACGSSPEGPSDAKKGDSAALGITAESSGHADADAEVFVGHSDPIVVMTVLADGRIASGDTAGTIRVWDVWSGISDVIINTGRTKLYTVDQLLDGRLVTGSPSGLEIWDLSDPASEPLVIPDSRNTYGVAVLSDGTIAFGNASAIVEIWDPDDLSNPLALYEQHSAAGEFQNITYDVVELSNGMIASAASGEVHIWDRDKPGVTVASSGESQQPAYFSITELSDGRLASVSTNGLVYLWDIDRPRSDQPVYPGPGSFTGSDVIALDGDLVASRGAKVWIWSLSDPSTSLATYENEDATAMVLLPDGRLAIGYYDGELHLWKPTVN